jgi:hypothetical protein
MHAEAAAQVLNCWQAVDNPKRSFRMGRNMRLLGSMNARKKAHRLAERETRAENKSRVLIISFCVAGVLTWAG